MAKVKKTKPKKLCLDCLLGNDGSVNILDFSGEFGFSEWDDQIGVTSVGLYEADSPEAMTLVLCVLTEEETFLVSLLKSFDLPDSSFRQEEGERLFLYVIETVGSRDFQKRHSASILKMLGESECYKSLNLLLDNIAFIDAFYGGSAKMNDTFWGLVYKAMDAFKKYKPIAKKKFAKSKK